MGDCGARGERGNECAQTLRAESDLDDSVSVTNMDNVRKEYFEMKPIYRQLHLNLQGNIALT